MVSASKKVKREQGKRDGGVTLKIVIREGFPEEVTSETQGSERVSMGAFWEECS